jgi:Flp pilus assembly protein TadD
MDQDQLDLGISYIVRGEYQRALRTFQQIVERDPKEARAWSYLGLSHAHLGHGTDAEQALSKAIELAPGDPEAWFHLGVARSIRSEWPQAAIAYRHAVAGDPDDLMGWNQLGKALAESGDQPGAEAAFQRALVLSRETGDEPLPGVSASPEDRLAGLGKSPSSPREAENWLDLSLKLLSLGEEEEAVAAYEQAYALDPGRASQSLFSPMRRLISAASASTPGKGR